MLAHGQTRLPTFKCAIILPAVLLLCTAGCQPGHETTSTSETSVGKSSLPPKLNDTAPEVDIQSPATEIAQPPAAPIPQLLFQEVSENVQLQHTYLNGSSGQLFMYESIGGGAGWLDFDRDGQLDLFCVQAGQAVGDQVAENVSDALFRQQGASQFNNVSPLAGIDEVEYGQGVTIADFNNDGFDDIYVTNLQKNELWSNCGDGTFTRTAEAACCQSQRWSSSAGWADLNLDGNLDLYVCNYLQYDPNAPIPCRKDGQPALCHPRQIEAWPDEYYVNNGDGSFTESSRTSGLFGEGNKALGVVVSDLNQDGWPDVYVANDTTANFYFENQKDGSFSESSLRLGGGLNAEGAMQASMGIALGDYNHDGLPDLFLTHFTGESNTLYENMGPLGLHDVSGITGLFPISMPKLAFGTVMSDLDRNGYPDLFVANGHIDENNADGDGFEQSAQVLTFNGKRWEDHSQSAGQYFQNRCVGRGVALGDYDSDGDPDIVVAHQNKPLGLLQNQASKYSWLTVVPIATSSNRSSIGLKAELQVGERKWVEFIGGGTSFGSSHQHQLFFGVGEPTTEVGSLVVTWPNGKQSTLAIVRLNQILTVREP